MYRFISMGSAENGNNEINLGSIRIEGVIPAQSTGRLNGFSGRVPNARHLKTHASNVAQYGKDSLLDVGRQGVLPTVGRGSIGSIRYEAEVIMDKFIGFESPEFKELSGQIKEALRNVDAVREKHHPTLADKRYLTGEEIMEYLHISPRTLQNLRDQRVICFTTIGGKILYPEDELEEVLHQNYRSPELPF